MSVSYDAYKMFYYTGKYMNITRAASEMLVSQSTVSRGLQSLEAFFGCRLFERSRNGVAFTPEGELLYGYISEACELIAKGEEQILRKGGITLRIGAAEFVTNFFILPALEDLHRIRPDLKLEMVSKGFTSYSAAVESLIFGKTDLACVAVDSDEIYMNDAIEVISDASFHDILVAGEMFDELKNGSYSMKDLYRYPFASLNLEPSSEPVLNKLFRNLGVQAAPEFETDSLNVFRSVVRNGHSLALIPEFLKEHFFRDSHLFEVQVKEPLPSYSIAVLTLKNTSRSYLEDEVITRLTRHIKLRMGEVSGLHREIKQR